MNLHRWTRIGLLLLPVGALTFLITTPWRGHWLAADEPQWTEWVLSDGFRAYAAATVNGTGWVALGVLCLYLWLRESSKEMEWQVFWGTMLSITGALTLMPALGMMAMEWPHLAEAGTAHIAQSTTESGFWLLWIVWSAVTYAVGSIFLGWALWNRGHKPAAGLYAVGASLAGIPFWLWLEIAGVTLWTAGCVWIAWLAWQKPQKAKRRKQPA